MKKLYYKEENGEFYWVKETLKVSKEKNRKHCLNSYDDKHICIYPFQAGIPFYLEPATMTHITSEIANCLQ